MIRKSETGLPKDHAQAKRQISFVWRLILVRRHNHALTIGG
jgi:hypothetical protein